MQLTNPIKTDKPSASTLRKITFRAKNEAKLRQFLNDSQSDNSSNQKGR
jgi:hypothetical protein